MAKQRLFDSIVRCMEPVLREAGFSTGANFLVRDYLALGLAERWVPLSHSDFGRPVRWHRELGGGVVHSINLWREKHNARRFGVGMGVSVSEAAPEGSVRRLYPVTFGDRLEDHMGKTAYKCLKQVMDLTKPCAMDEREQVIRDALLNHVLPCLDGLSNRQTITERYRKPDPPPGFDHFAIIARPILGLPKYRCPAPAFDMSVVGNPTVRFTDKAVRSGGVSLLNAWHSSWPQCREGHAVLTRIKEKAGVPLYGIAWGLKAETAARFLRKHGDPYDICGVSPGANEAWVYGTTLRLDLEGAGLPFLAVVDGKGLMIERYYAPIREEEIEPYLLPEIEAAKRPYDWPHDYA